MTNEIKIGEITFVPDTHCVDADTGLDVWSFSPGLVREMLSAREQSNDGCGACGDGCRERGSCRVKDESPELPINNESLTEIRKQRDELLADDYRLRLSIRLRNPYVDPISLLQVDLLQRWRAGDRADDALLRALVSTVNGIAAGIQNTG